ncbi:MAG: LURP-one-related/scramblase family protein, partial [Promethearchaeota archaeon]
MSLQKTREFLLQEKLVSFRDKVKVMNPNKEILGYFIGKIIKIANKYRLKDLNDKTILVVKEKMISLRSTYSFYKTEKDDPDDSELIGKMKRKLVSIKPKYWFENPNEEKVFTMKGNIWALKYSIQKDGKDIAWINKKLFKIKGTYGVKIDPDL